MDIAEKKVEQRRAGIAARKSLDKETALRYSRTISEKLAADPAYREAEVVFSYMPFGGEVDISFFNQQAATDGKTVAFPICRKDSIMVAAVPLVEDAWETGKYGIRTPVEDHCRILAPEEIHLVIVPCTAFEGQSKIRVGMGAGYYDRFLPRCLNARYIAVAFEAQKVVDIAFDKWDIPLHAIATEAKWY